jgi:serine/threonine protein kinase/Leucine-rich repeat (LRR) protein
VYLGYDGSLDRKVALKVMLPEFAANTTARERFLREAKSAARVKSDHVVTIHDVGEDNGIPFIAMEYLHGAPLDQYLQAKGELALEHAIRVTRETAIGLSAVHALGLVHRDIKPGNIWLEAPKGRVKLLDFGLARRESDDVQITGNGAVMGTVAYMSPEQGRGQKIDARSDLFSLGVMLYRLATGHMPFLGETAMVVLTNIAIEDPIPPRQHNPRISNSLEAVILKLLAKTPANRFQTAEQAAQALLEASEPSTELPVVVAIPLPSLSVGAQTQNVWEDVFDSQSVAVPLSTPSEPTLNDSPPVAKPKRAVPERKVSKVPLYLAGGVLLAACAVLAAVLLWPKKPKEDVAQKDDKKSIKQSDKVPDDKKTDPLPKVDADAIHTKAVEWILLIGGTAQVSANGVQREVATRADLPKEPFVLTGVQIRNNEKVTDEGLRNLKDCHTIRAINVSNTPITDAGLAHLKDLKNLELLWASATGITDAGLVHLQNAKQLTELNLAQTNVTDAGLAYFKDCPKLNTLIVYTTGLTDKGFAIFKGSTTISYLQLGNTRITNEGLATFRDNKNLTFLHVTDTKIGDAGISYFKDCTALKGLVLFNTEVTDAVIPSLREFKNLTELNVQKTKITAPGIAELQKLLPNCRIEHDGDVIEPKASTDDRETAKYILGVGGRVRAKTATETVPVFKLEELPAGPLAVTYLELTDKDLSDDGWKKIAALRSLTQINIHGATFTDAIASQFSSLNVEEIRVTNTKVGDRGLAALAAGKKVRRVDVSSTAVGDTGLKSLAVSPDLIDLTLTKTAITDAGLAHLKDAEKLIWLHLNDTAITDEGLKHLEGLQALRQLTLRGTKVTEPALKALKLKLHPDCEIEWDKGKVKP